MEKNEERRRLFEENIERYARFDPSIAHLISEGDFPDYTYCHTHLGELNLCRHIEGAPPLYYHSVNGAKKEALQWAKKLKLDKYKALFVYGVGLGYYYDAVKEWLHKDEQRRLIFIEDELPVLCRLFGTQEGKRLLEDPQVIIKYFFRYEENFSAEFQTAVARIIRGFARGVTFLSTLNLYAEKKEAICKEIRNQLFFGITQQSMQYNELTTNMPTLFSNFYRNTLRIFRSGLAPLTAGKWANVPLVIVGAGPSLMEEIDKVKEILPHALVMASGTAMNILNKRGIIPHLGAAIDPSSSQFSRLRTNSAFEVPYYYRARLNDEAFGALHGPKIFVNGFSCFETPRWFEEKLGIFVKETIPMGISTTNFCLGLGIYLGCNPIIFTGVDLSYTDASRYPEGLSAHPSEKKGEHADLYAKYRKMLVVKGIGGDDVYTKIDWLMEADLITEMQLKNPDYRLINATRKGMQIKGLLHLSLDEVKKRELQEEIEIEDRLHATVQDAAMEWVTKERVLEAFEEWKATLTRSLELLKGLEEELYRLFEACREGKDLPKMRPYSGLQALLETELCEEDAYRYHIQLFSYVINTIAIPKRHLLKCHPELFSLKERALLELEIELNTYVYYQKIAEEQLRLIKEAMEEFEEEEAALAVKKRSEMITTLSLPSGYRIEKGEFHLVDEELGIKIIDTYDETATEIPSDGLFKEGKGEGQWFSDRYYLNGKLHGPLRFFSKEGTLLSESFFFHGVKEGKARYFTRSGKPYALLQFKHGMREGEQRTYFEGGNLKSLLSFQGGLLHGKVLLYHENGQLKRALFFEKGLLQGKEQEWDASGRLMTESTYDKGTPSGTSESWHANGQRARRVIYHTYPSKFDLYEWDREGNLINQELSVPLQEFDDRCLRKKRLVSALTLFEQELAQVSSLTREEIQKMYED